MVIPCLYPFSTSVQAFTVCDPMFSFGQLYPEEDFLTGDDLLFEYNPEVCMRNRGTGMFRSGYLKTGL